MGITIGAMLEEIQGLYQQHHQPCFLYLSSEVIKVKRPFSCTWNFSSSLHQAFVAYRGEYILIGRFLDPTLLVQAI